MIHENYLWERCIVYVYVEIIDKTFHVVSCPRPFVNFLRMIYDIDLEEEEGQGVADEGGGHVHRPEDARVASDGRRVWVVRQQISLGEDYNKWVWRL